MSTLSSSLTVPVGAVSREPCDGLSGGIPSRPRVSFVRHFRFSLFFNYLRAVACFPVVCQTSALIFLPQSMYIFHLFTCFFLKPGPTLSENTLREYSRPHLTRTLIQTMPTSGHFFTGHSSRPEPGETNRFLWKHGGADDTRATFARSKWRR